MSIQAILSVLSHGPILSTLSDRFRVSRTGQPAANVRCIAPKSLRARGGFGLNEVIGIAAGIIIAVIIVIPGLQVFAGNVISQLTSWWNGMAADIFKS